MKPSTDEGRVAARAFAAGLPRWIFELMASGKLAVSLIASLVALLLAYLLVPQVSLAGRESVNAWLGLTGRMGDTLAVLGLTDVRRSPVLWLTLALLFANLFSCMLRRLRVAIFMARTPERPPRITPQWIERRVDVASADTDRVSRLLRRRGYYVKRFGGDVYGVSGRFAVFGSWLFHTGMLVLMAGGAVVALRSEPFRGAVGVGEGEIFDLHSSAFLGSNHPPSESLPALSFKVDGIHVVTDRVDVREFETRIETSDGQPSAIGVNRPYRRDHYQVLGRGFGYMPGWAVVDRRGRMVRGAWIKLAPHPIESEEKISIGPRTSSVSFRFFPDYESAGGENRSLSWELRNPIFRARVELRGTLLHDGLLAPGERVKLEEGLWFFFLPEVRRYALLEVREESGHASIFASLGIMILGLFIRYGRIRKEVLVTTEGGVQRLFGRSEILESLFEEEIDKLAVAMSAPDPALAARVATA